VAAAIAAVTGLGRLVAAENGKADNRDENREAEQKFTIHPRILQITGTVIPNTNATHT
jgi:hypothetical protein